MNIYKAWRTVKESTIVDCWRKEVILISNNDYIVELNNLKLDIEHKEEIQRVKTDYVKMLEKFRADYF
jgi:hypothetical protein